MEKEKDEREAPTRHYAIQKMATPLIAQTLSASASSSIMMWGKK